MHFLGITALLLALTYASAQGNRQIAAILSVNNGGRFGTWGTQAMCPDKTFVGSFRQKIHRPCGTFCDDTASNGVELACVDPSSPGATQGTVSSSVGPFGDWLVWRSCPTDSYIVAFRHDMEPYQGSLGDDTKTNNIDVRCRHKDTGALSEVTGESPTPWGTSRAWSHQCPDNSAVCGIQTKVEPRVSGDNTALNDLYMYCCPTNS